MRRAATSRGGKARRRAPPKRGRGSGPGRGRPDRKENTDISMTHMKYTQQQIDALRQTSMRDILAVEGYDTSHTRDGLFFSPFRAKERTPSFHIDDAGHRWFDHGDPFNGVGGRRGGDTIGFVQRLKGCSFLEALDYLCRYNPSVVPCGDAVTVPRGEDAILSDGGGEGTYAGTAVVAVMEHISDFPLRDYARSRRIPDAVLDRYCREVHYAVQHRDGDGVVHSRRHKAIGFPNSGGGWVLRYIAGGKGRGKRSTGGGYTALDRDGRLMRQKEARTTAPSVIVFEGFFDFMSWIADKRPEGIPGDADVVVLNSVANAPAAMPQITDHRTVIAMLDNDAAGDSATALLHEAADAAGCRFVDARRLFAGYGDYNDKRQAERRTAKAG